MLTHLVDRLFPHPSEEGSSRLHLFSIDERHRNGINAAKRLIYWRGFAHFDVPLNPVCRARGCDWQDRDAYTLPGPLWGWLDLSWHYRAEYDAKRAKDAQRDRERQERTAERTGKPVLDHKRIWRQCARCMRRERVVTVRVGEVRDWKSAVVAGQPGDRRVEADIEVITGKIEVGLEARVGNSLHLRLAVPGIRAYLRLNGIAPRVCDLLAPRLGEAREIGFRLYGDSMRDVVFTYDLWTAEILSEDLHHGTWRKGYHPLKRTVLGKYVRTVEATEEADLTVTLPEGEYPIHAKMERVTSHRARTPWRRKTSFSFNVKVLAKGGIPEPGNLDSDFYSGNDACHGVSWDEKYGNNWQAVAVAKTIETVLRERLRHGGSVDWVPVKVEPVPAAEAAEPHPDSEQARAALEARLAPAKSPVGGEG